MTLNNYCVYKHTAPNGKSYIGITKQTPEKRWKNGKGYELCTAFNRAIHKYGWKNIRHEIIASGLDEKTACELEIKYIALFDTANPEHGYNLTNGGEHYTPNAEWRERARNSHFEYYKNHPEARDRIARSQLGRKPSEQTREKMREARKRYISEHPEIREQCRVTFKGMKRSESNREKLRLANMQKIVCVETGEVFDSVADAAAFVGVCRTSVSNQLIGRSKSCGGKHFKYV